MRRQRFLTRKFPKLQTLANGLLKVLQKNGYSAYKIELSNDYGVSTTFNVSDLSPYIDDEPLDLRVSLFQLEENDSDGSSLNLA